MKRKRKEHRSLDSILFEDDGELEYFDVLNLLPLSNVRLEFDEDDARNNNLEQRNEASLKSLEYLDSRAVEERSSTRSNATDEEKCKESSSKEGNSPQEIREDDYQHPESDCSHRTREGLSAKYAGEELCHEEDFEDDRDSISCLQNEFDTDANGYRLDEELGVPCEDQVDRKVEEAEDYKSIWISDTEEQEDMSRRPQVLKVVDNDVTKRRHRRVCVDAPEKNATNNCADQTKSNRKSEDVDGALKSADVSSEEISWKNAIVYRPIGP